MTRDKDSVTTQVTHAGSRADDDDDDRCPCAECRLKFHREMARCFRELVSLKPNEDGLQGRTPCKKVKAGLRSKRKKRIPGVLSSI